MQNLIRVDRFPDVHYKLIEWTLHDVCNYDCSFCSESYKSGKNRWLSLEEYKQNVDTLIEQCGDSPVWFLITGGEPTLFPELTELLQYIKQKGVYVAIITNGSRTIRWWEELKNSDSIDYLTITYHPEQTTDYFHVAEVLNLFHDKPVRTHCIITQTKETIDLAFTARDYLLKNTGTSILIKPMAIGAYNIWDFYSESQLKIINDSWTLADKSDTKMPPNVPDNHKTGYRVSATYDDGSTKVLPTSELIASGQTNFYDWNCSIGMDTMKIISKNVFRGVCEMGGVQSVLPIAKFSTSPIVCKKTSCNCNSDLITTKIK